MEENKKEKPKKPLTFGLQMKFPIENMGLYYLAQRASLLYETLQKMPLHKKSSFQNKVQQLFTTVTNEIEQMISFSSHLPVIMEIEKDKIQWKIFNAEREWRIYHYLQKAEGTKIADLDKKLDDITFKLWNSYHRYYESIQEYDLESQLFEKLEYVIIWTSSDRKDSDNSSEDTEKKPRENRKKIISIASYIIYPLLATVYIINGLRVFNWWDLFIGFTLLIATVIFIYTDSSKYSLLVNCLVLGIYLLEEGARLIIVVGDTFTGACFVVFAVFMIVSGSILNKLK